MARRQPTTKTIREAMKAIDAEIRVAAERGHPGYWTIRTGSRLDEVRERLAELGLRERDMEIEGGRYDWTYAVYVQLDGGK